VHVVVIGCGRVGSELAGALEQAGHTVAVVDKVARAFRRLPQGFTGTTVVGFGFDRDHLHAAGIDKAGAFASVTSGDNSNILCARIARETYGIEHVVARIYDPRRALIYQRLGIPTVATVAWTTDQVLRRLIPSETSNDWVDPTGKVGLIERQIPPKAVGRKLALLKPKLWPWQTQTCVAAHAARAWKGWRQAGCACLQACAKYCVRRSSGGNQFAQHVRQNPAVPVVINFNRSIDAQKQFHLTLRSIRSRDDQRHILLRTNFPAQAADVEGFVSANLQGVDAIAAFELKRQHAHSNQIGTVYTLEALCDYGPDAQQLRPFGGPVAR